MSELGSGSFYVHPEKYLGDMARNQTVPAGGCTLQPYVMQPGRHPMRGLPPPPAAEPGWATPRVSWQPPAQPKLQVGFTPREHCRTRRHLLELV